MYDTQYYLPKLICCGAELLHYHNNAAGSNESCPNKHSCIDLFS